MFRFSKTTTAKGMLVNLASKLPDKLLLTSVDEEVRFTKSFLLRLTDEQLESLSEEGQKQGDHEFFLFFYSVPEEKIGKETPCEVTNFSNFDFSKVSSVTFNGNTAPFLPYVDAPPVHYVSVILVT